MKLCNEKLSVICLKIIQWCWVGGITEIRLAVPMLITAEAK